MTTFDFSPLFRTSVGFDRLASMMNAAHRSESGNGFPPYNIQKADENHYRITMAVAGFSEADLDITSEHNTLTVRGTRPEETADDDSGYLYRGIATRNFERRFNLADHVKVSGARLDNGLLHIELEREIPEEMKPRKIEIRGDGRTRKNFRAAKEATEEDLQTLRSVSRTMNGKTICVFAPAASSVIDGFLKRFEDEFRACIKENA